VAFDRHAVADRVDARVHAAEPPDLNPVLNLVAARAQGHQLLPGHHTVLPSSQLGDLHVEVSRRGFAGRWHGFYVLYP
jgi:hypothetical protein